MKLMITVSTELLFISNFLCFHVKKTELYKPTWLKVKERLDCKPGQSQKCRCILSVSDLELQKTG